MRRQQRYPLAVRKKNPLSTGQEIGIAALVLLGLAGAAYYFVYANKNVVVGLKITGYRNKSQNGPIVAPGVTLNVQQMDVVTVYVQWSYHGQQQLNYTLEATTWAPYTSFHLDWWNNIQKIDKVDQSINIASSLLPKTYYASLDLQIANGKAGNTYSLGVEIYKPGADYYSGQITKAIDVTNAPPPGTTGITNINMTPVTTTPIPVTGGSFEFKLDFDYTGKNISNFTILARAGDIFPTFAAAPGAQVQTNPETLETGHSTFDIVLPVPASAVQWLQSQPSGVDHSSMDLDLLIGYNPNVSPGELVIKIYDKAVPIANMAATMAQPTVAPSDAPVGTTFVGTANISNTGTVDFSGQYEMQFWHDSGLLNLTHTLMSDSGILPVSVGVGANKDVTFSYAPTTAGTYRLHAVLKAASGNDLVTHDQSFNCSSGGGGGNNPALIVSPASIASGQALTVGISGFNPTDYVYLAIAGVEVGIINTDSSGAGGATIYPSETPGTYTLVGTDSSGHTAQAKFSVTGGTPPPTPALTITSTQSDVLGRPEFTQGGTVSFSFAHFTPNAVVTIENAETYSSMTVQADSSGNGSGSFTDNDAPGVYTLVARDNSYTASADFVILPSTTTTPQVVLTDAFGSPTNYIDLSNQVLYFNISGFPATTELVISVTDPSGQYAYASSYRYTDASGNDTSDTFDLGVFGNPLGVGEFVFHVMTTTGDVAASEAFSVVQG